jgi:signal transduction histidine kinase
MDAHEASRMFQPYVRGEHQHGEGHGVGLTIVRRFCDRFHWPIRFQSAPGQGTSVRVSFPNAVFRGTDTHAE